MKTKKTFNRFDIITIVVVLFTFASCQKDFTDRPSEDGISLDSYYSSNEQVISATNGMYSRTWFQFNNKFFYAIAEVGSGNMYTNSSDVNGMRTFSLSSSDSEMYNGWCALWTNVAQANAIINFLPERVGPAVTSDVLNNTVGEAYFMRATAYFYLVRLWGAVPIIKNNLDYASNPVINTNRVEDIYKLIELDYQAAILNLASNIRTSNYSANGRVSKGSAKAMLAKVYLYEQKFAQSKAMAEDVINSGEFKLLGGTLLPSKTFADLFTYSNNNNEESIFALQWKGDGNYGSANNCNTQFGISNGTISTSNASYGGVFAPSQDIMNAYSDSDLRKHETIMFPGHTYSNIKVSGGGNLTVPPTNQIGGQGAGTAIKKYCIGIVNGTTTGPADNWAMMDNNTYIMRYADLLLIHAEATLAGGTSTSDAGALASFNAVRNRAGQNSLTSISFANIFNERRLELCFEGDYWFDLGRIPRSQAISIMAAQNRGNMFAAEYYTPSITDFLLPYPDKDVSKNPLLLEPPVPYNF